MIEPFRRPGFRRLAISYTVNELGDWMGIVALSVLVFELTGSALATTLLFLGNFFLPALLTPLLVARIERPPPRFVLPVLYAGEAAAFGALALLAEHFSLAAVVIVATFDGTLALAARALTRSVAAAMLTPHGELRAGNAILNVAFTGGAAVGPAIAGATVAALGVQTALLLDAASFYVIAWILLTAGRLPQAKLEGEPAQMLRRLRAGFTYIREHTTLRRLLTAQAAALLFFAAVLPIEVIYAKETLGAGDAGYGLLLGSWGAGMVFGSLIFAAVRQAPLALLLILSTFGVGMGYIGMAVAPTLVAACAAAALGGTGNGVQWVAAISAVQELTSDAMQARVVSVLESLGAAMPGLGFIAGGVIASIAGPRLTFTVAGLGVVLVAAVFTPVLSSSWRLERRRSAVDAANEVVLELHPARPAPPGRDSAPNPEHEGSGKHDDLRRS